MVIESPVMFMELPASNLRSAVEIVRLPIVFKEPPPPPPPPPPSPPSPPNGRTPAVASARLLEVPEDVGASIAIDRAETTKLAEMLLVPVKLKSPLD